MAGADVTLHPETRNHGFGRGNNIVLDLPLQDNQPPEFVMLSNPDVRLDNAAPDIRATFLEKYPQAGCAGVRVSQPSAGPVTAAFRFPASAIEFISSANLGPVTKKRDTVACS